MIAILNSSILTSFGEYIYKELNFLEVKELMKNGFTSYVAHPATNEVIGKVLGIELPYHREMYFQKSGESAIVFKLNKRLSEGEVLKTIAEIEAIGYTFGLLIKK